MGAVGIWAAGAFGAVHALRIRTTVMENGAAFLDELRLSATQGIGEFVTLVDQGGATSLTLIVVWAGIAFALGAAVLVVGLRRMLSVGGIGLFVVAALSVVAILLAGLTGYVQLTSFAGMTLAGPVVDLLLLLLGRVGLIAVVLFGIGRVRLARSAPAELVAA